MVKALPIQLSESDIRLFRCEDGYRYGIYLERDKPSPANTRAILCVYRVPTGTQAPKGRISDADLLKLANEGLKEVEPEVIARFPYWSYIHEVQDVPDDATFEEAQVLPPSLKDRFGAYVEPPNSMQPLEAAKTTPTKVEKPSTEKQPTKTEGG